MVTISCGGHWRTSAHMQGSCLSHKGLRSAAAIIYVQCAGSVGSPSATVCVGRDW